MTTPNHEPSAGSHANHDRLLISAHAAGDLAGRDLLGAEALLARCGDCRILHADLLAIASTAGDLPAPVPAAARDFRIRPERAAELARGGLWRRLVRPFGRPNGASRPLSLAFTTLGVAGLLLAALPSLNLNSGDYLAASAPETTDGRNALQVTDEPRGTSAPEFVASPGTDTMGGSGALPDEVDSSAGQGSGQGQGAGAGAGPTAGPTGGKVVPESTPIDAGGSSGPSPLVFLSIAFLAAGLGLLVLRVTALRLR